MAETRHFKVGSVVWECHVGNGVNDSSLRHWYSYSGPTWANKQYIGTTVDFQTDAEAWADCEKFMASLGGKECDKHGVPK